MRRRHALAAIAALPLGAGTFGLRACEDLG